MPALSEDKLVFIYTTFPNKDVALTIAKQLLREKLAACVNLFPNMTAVYEWQGELEVDEECAALFKTQASYSDSVCALIKSLHPYDVPALVVLPTQDVDVDYAAWASGQLTP